MFNTFVLLFRWAPFGLSNWTDNNKIYEYLHSQSHVPNSPDCVLLLMDCVQKVFHPYRALCLELLPLPPRPLVVLGPLGYDVQCFTIQMLDCAFVKCCNPRVLPRQYQHHKVLQCSSLPAWLLIKNNYV